MMLMMLWKGRDGRFSSAEGPRAVRFEPLKIGNAEQHKRTPSKASCQGSINFSSQTHWMMICIVV